MDGTGYHKKTVAILKELCKERGIAFTSKDKKADIIAHLVEADEREALSKQADASASAQQPETDADEGTDNQPMVEDSNDAGAEAPAPDHMEDDSESQATVEPSVSISEVKTEVEHMEEESEAAVSSPVKIERGENGAEAEITETPATATSSMNEEPAPTPDESSIPKRTPSPKKGKRKAEPLDEAEEQHKKPRTDPGPESTPAPTESHDGNDMNGTSDSRVADSEAPTTTKEDTTTGEQGATNGHGVATTNGHETEMNTDDGGRRILLVRGFTRPLQLPAVEELMSRYGSYRDLWMNKIKTHCFVTYDTAHEASTAKEAIEGMIFQPNTGKHLTADLVTEKDREETKASLESSSNRQPPLPPGYGGRGRLNNGPPHPLAISGPNATPAANGLTIRGRSSVSSVGSREPTTPHKLPPLPPKVNPAVNFFRTNVKPRLYYAPVNKEKVRRKWQQA
ncbi:hypothetical protein HDV00_001169 [Rhizophlyctis rosea]|nr:hypothetical protein HDV00_001169 [Rhizophlyctis rosea]